MDRRQIQKERMNNYFIDATCKIIEEEGVNAVTVRKVAEIAGYHYATIYNYFEDLPHLILQASMRFHEQYGNYIKAWVQPDLSAWDFYLASWEGFVRFSLVHPNIFRCLFMDGYGEIGIDQIHEEMKASPLLNGSQRAIERLVAEEVVLPEDAERFNTAVTSLCVGNISLNITMRFRNTEESVIANIMSGIQWMRQGLIRP